MNVSKIKELIDAADKGDNLEVKIEPRMSMNSSEVGGDILIERVITPDYIRITRIYEAKMPSKVRNNDITRTKSKSC